MAVPSLPLCPDKMALRRRAREQRRAFVAELSASDREDLEQALSDHLAPLIRNSRQVGAYAPFPDEISPLPAVTGTEGISVGFPAFRDHQTSFRFLAGEPVENGPFGILQPALDAPELRPDLILVPLVAIDAKGNRLGQGKGHYDRVLPALKRAGAMLIGLGWDIQKLDTTLEPEAWDVPMDGFASPSGLEMYR